MNLSPEIAAKLPPDHPIFQCLERLEIIQDKMIKNDPEIKTHLKAVHDHLRQYEELAHLLSVEQIGVLMKGLQKHTTISLAIEEKPKTRGKSSKVGVSDLL